MSKICILSTVNLKHMTLISKYTDYLDEHLIDYDIICIDKYGDNEENNAKNFYPFELKIQRNWGKLKKIRHYLKFRKFANNIIKKNKYDKIIVWNSYTAMMFTDTLLKNKGKYCINIRDYANEKNKIIFSLMSVLIKNSAFTTISSNGFKVFLPDYEYLTIHSFNPSVLKNAIPTLHKRSSGEPIRISFMGYVRFYKFDKLVLDTFANDERFVIQFFGEGSAHLKEYADSKKYRNTNFYGRFEPIETSNFLNMTDIINNLYGYNEIALDTAISIKTYYGAYLHKPLLVFKNTYMSELVNRYKFGYSVSNDMSLLPDELYDWYSNLNFEEFSKNCDEFIKKSIEENCKFYERLHIFLS